MKILVYGGGAVGGYLAAQLAHNGHQVTVITRPVTADGINENGLSVIKDNHTIHAQLTAVTSVAQAFLNTDSHYDLIIMSMKAYDLVAAMDPLIAFCPNPSKILTVQNGIDIEQPLIKQFGAERIISGALTTPISKQATHQLVIERQDRGLALAPTKPKQTIKKWVALFQDAGIETIGIRNYRAMKWSKALLNIIGNATSAILNRSPTIIYKSEAMFALELQMLRETLDVMRKQKLKPVDLPGSPVKQLASSVRRMPRFLLKPILTQNVAKGRGDKMPSFHIDLASGKQKSEVIYHNGAIAESGLAYKVPTPVNQALSDILVKLTKEEIDWRLYDGKPKQLLTEVRKYERAVKIK